MSKQIALSRLRKAKAIELMMSLNWWGAEAQGIDRIIETLDSMGIKQFVIAALKEHLS
jgi:5,10-methylenetetrahydrofolate reductase